MNPKTVQKLNKLNNRFYSITAKDWDDSRSYSWQGWDRLLSEIKSLNPNLLSQPVKVLDIGCGNGRFIEFLKKNGIEFVYTGLDFNEDLLEIAKDRYAKEDNVDFIKSDLAEVGKLKDKYDLIVSFGVMHHVAGESNRLHFIRNSLKLLGEDGYLVITLWKFNEFDRFKKKAVDPNLVDINSEELEEGDYILDWKRGERAYRYAHYVGISETGSYIHETNAEILSSFRADGKEKKVNEYLIIRNFRKDN